MNTLTEKQSPNKLTENYKKTSEKTCIHGSTPCSDTLHKKQQDLEKEQIPKEFEDMINILLFPEKFWSIFEKLQKEEYNKGITFAKEEILKEINKLLAKGLNKQRPNLEHTQQVQIYSDNLHKKQQDKQ